METRRIGSLEATVIGVGCNNFGWRIDAEASTRVVDAALEAGINFFDTADIYGEGRSEEYLGKALRGRRNKAIIATKFGGKMDEQRQGAGPEYVKQAAEASLRRLGIDSIDLYQLHKPDPKTQIGDTLEALDDLVREGKIREIGCSNFTAEQIRIAYAASRAGAARFVSVQNEYSLIRREAEAEVIPECVRLGLAFLPYFPLASGLLTGKYRKGGPVPRGSRAEADFGPSYFTEKHLELAEVLVRFAEARGHTLLELAFSWLLTQPVASVIAGATSAEQVKANAAAVGWRLTEADLKEIDSILSPVPQAE
jgi:aryl-alcohol dehydrogenase-like predicted oxidoreductase